MSSDFIASQVTIETSFLPFLHFLWCMAQRSLHAVTKAYYRSMSCFAMDSHTKWHLLHHVVHAVHKECHKDGSHRQEPSPLNRARLTAYSITNVKPRSEIAGTKPPYVCPGCFIHTYSNNMINRFHVQ
jgi:hypothetical protein